MQTNRQFVFQGLFRKGAFFIAILVAFRGQGDSPTKIEDKTLHQLIQIAPGLYSGAEPDGEAAFARLAELGIKTVVSVDGIQPNVALAKQHRLRYVHIPIGYDGIDEEAGYTFARLAKDAEGPLYIHCHHGVHRGPAAAAITAIAAGLLSNEEGTALLKQAGTSPNYAGLWRDVAAYQAPEADVALPDLHEVATSSSLAVAMASLDRAFDELKALRRTGWQVSPEHPDVVPEQQALLVREGLQESARTQGDSYDDAFGIAMREAIAQARGLEEALRNKKLSRANAHLKTLAASCTPCHKQYRN